MDGFQISNMTLFENRFWLQIMGDHARFIFYSLSPTESQFIRTAQEFIIQFDELLDQFRSDLSSDNLNHLQEQALQATYQFRGFKLQLLAMSLDAELKSHLSSSFFNDMINELDEYLLTINILKSGRASIFHPIHYHMLWLFDAVGHAATLSAEFDFIEKDMIDKANQYEIIFNDLNMKAIIMNGYLRTQLSSFPSLDRLNEQANQAMIDFNEFLENIRDQRMDGRILGTILPLMADHMAREECYYLWKLSQSAKNVKRPNCDPTRPRVES